MKAKMFLSLLLLATVVPGAFAAGGEDDTKDHSRTKSALVALVDAPAGPAVVQNDGGPVFKTAYTDSASIY